MKRFFICLILLLIGTITAAACTCTDTREYYYKKAKMIFQGKIDSISTADMFNVRKATFSVLKRWKGGAKEKVTIFVADSGPCSGFKFQEGTTYLIYANPTTYYREGKEFAYDMYASSDCGVSRDINGEYANDEYTKKVIRQLGSPWFRFKARW